MNRQLRESVSRGFSLSLTHDQCRALCLAARNDGAETDAGAVAQLLRRGLVHVATDVPRPTRAGGHVVGLIREAGLFGYYTQGGTPHE